MHAFFHQSRTESLLLYRPSKPDIIYILSVTYLNNEALCSPKVDQQEYGKESKQETRVAQARNRI
jgi:hypothetical protein